MFKVLIVIGAKGGMDIDSAVWTTITISVNGWPVQRTSGGMAEWLMDSSDHFTSVGLGL